MGPKHHIWVGVQTQRNKGIEELKTKRGEKDKHGVVQLAKKRKREKKKEKEEKTFSHLLKWFKLLPRPGK